MNIKILLFSAVLIPATSFAIDFEQNGVAYEFYSDGYVMIVPPTTGKYTGTFEVKPTVTYNNFTYRVATSALPPLSFGYSWYDYYNPNGLFNGSEIEEFIVGEDWNKYDYKLPQIGFCYNNKLKKIVFNSTDSDEPSLNYNFINVGHTSNCIDVEIRHIGDDKYDMIIHKFEVYNKYGAKCTPMLFNYMGKFYTPKSDNTFHLTFNGAYYLDDEYTGCVKLSSGQDIIYLWITDGDGYRPLRVEPDSNRASVNDIVNDMNCNQPAQYFDMQGRPLNGEPISGGIYIVKRGNSAQKIFIK